MRALPDLSLLVGQQLGFRGKIAANARDSPVRVDPSATESDFGVEKLVRKSTKRKEREDEGCQTDETETAEGTSAGDGSGTRKKAKKGPAGARPTTVERDEL